MLARYQHIPRLVFIAGIFALAVAACGPAPAGLSPEQVQVLVATSVAQTVEAQNYMGTGVAMTVAAMQPATAPTLAPTDVPLFLPTFTPLATVTPFMVKSGGGGSGNGGKPDWACDVNTRPFDNTAYKPGDPFDIKWIITNTGAKTWAAGKDLEYSSGAVLTTASGVQLPQLKPGDTFTFKADANAPLEKGYYVMTWKVEGGFCWPYVAIRSGRPGIDP
jgi:hypothetical protein